MLLRPGDLIFTYKKHNLLSKLIDFISELDTRDIVDISHVAIYLGGGTIAESKFFGVTTRDITIYSGNNYNTLYCRVMPEYDQNKLVDYCKQSVNTIKYAYFQLLISGLSRIFKFLNFGDIQKNAMTCSEFVASAYNEVGIKLVKNRAIADISPLDIYNSEYVVRLNV